MGHLARLFVAGVVAAQRALWALLSTLLRSDNLWSVVDAAGIVVFVGPNGAGKSLAMVESVRRSIGTARWTCENTAHRHHAPYRAHAIDCEGCDMPADRPGTCPVGVALLADLQIDEFYDEHLPTCLGGCVLDAPPPVHCSVGFALIVDHGSGVRRVYSTVPLLGEHGGEHPLYRPLVDYRQLLTIEHADVLFDEVAGVSDSSDSAGVPVQVTNWLHQLRKRDVRLRVTTPAYSRCSKPIRQIAQVVVDARSFFPEPRQAGRVWRSRRAMLFTAFDAFEFVDYTETTKDRQKRLAKAAFWRPGSAAERLYNTLGAVLALGHVSDGGMCVVCAGTRSKPKCACPAGADDLLDVGRVEYIETVSAAGARVRKAVLPADQLTAAKSPVAVTSSSTATAKTPVSAVVS